MNVSYMYIRHCAPQCSAKTKSPLLILTGEKFNGGDHCSFSGAQYVGIGKFHTGAVTGYSRSRDVEPELCQAGEPPDTTQISNNAHGILKLCLRCITRGFTFHIKKESRSSSEDARASKNSSACAASRY